MNASGDGVTTDRSLLFSVRNEQRMSLQGSPVSFVVCSFLLLFVWEKSNDKISNQRLNSNLSKFKLGKTLTHKEGGDMVNVPLKKKKKENTQQQNKIIEHGT